MYSGRTGHRTGSIHNFEGDGLEGSHCYFGSRKNPRPSNKSLVVVCLDYHSRHMVVLVVKEAASIIPYLCRYRVGNYLLGNFTCCLDCHMRRHQ